MRCTAAMIALFCVVAPSVAAAQASPSGEDLCGVVDAPCGEVDAPHRAVCARLADAVRRDDPNQFLDLVPTAGVTVSTRDPTQSGRRVDRTVRRDALAVSIGTSVLGFLGLRDRDVATLRLLHQDLCDSCGSGPECTGCGGGGYRFWFLRLHNRARRVRLQFDRSGLTRIVIETR